MYKQRNIAIDILRALVMMLMIFVNDLWSIEGEPEWLGHSSAMQDYMGLSDIVFPCFLIVVGMSIPYALESRFAKGQSGIQIVGHVLSRSLALLLMGVFTVNSESNATSTVGLTLPWYRILMVIGFILVWNTYPRNASASQTRLFQALKWIGATLLVFLAVTYRNGNGQLFQSSWWGILGLIGWTYLVCAFVYLFVRDKIGALLIAWGVCVVLCVLRSYLHDGSTLLDLSQPNFFDQALDIFRIGTACHLALTMTGVIFTVLIVKYLPCLCPQRSQLAFLAICVCAWILGWIADQFFITSKIMATAPWLFYNIAIIAFAYAIISWLVAYGHANWFDCVKPAGVATLTCYVMPYITYSVAALLDIQLPLWLRTGWIGILNCIAYAFMVIWLTYLLTKLHIKLKV